MDNKSEIARLRDALQRINTDYREASGLPLHLQAYCMRSEAKAALGLESAEAWAAELAEIKSQAGEIPTEQLDALLRAEGIDPDRLVENVKRHIRSLKCYGCDEMKVFSGEFCDDCLGRWKSETHNTEY